MVDKLTDKLKNNSGKNRYSKIDILESIFKRNITERNLVAIDRITLDTAVKPHAPVLIQVPVNIAVSGGGLFPIHSRNAF